MAFYLTGACFISTKLYKSFWKFAWFSEFPRIRSLSLSFSQPSLELFRVCFRVVLTDHSKSQREKLKVKVTVDDLQHVSRSLQTHVDIFLRCVDPSGSLVTTFVAELCRCDSELDELTRQRLMSPVLTIYEKNLSLLRWLQRNSVTCLQAFLEAANCCDQRHVFNLLLGNTGLIIAPVDKFTGIVRKRTNVEL